MQEAQASVDPNAQGANKVQGLKAIFEGENSTANEQHGTQEITPLLEAQTSVDPNAKNTNIVQELKARVEKLGQALEELKEKKQQKMQNGTSLQERETAQNELEKIKKSQITFEKLKAKSEDVGKLLKEIKEQEQQKSLKEQENQERLSNGTSKKLSSEMERLKNFFDSCSKVKAIQIQYKDLTNNE